MSENQRFYDVKISEMMNLSILTPNLGAFRNQQNTPGILPIFYSKA